MNPRKTDTSAALRAIAARDQNGLSPADLAGINPGILGAVALHILTCAHVPTKFMHAMSAEDGVALGSSLLMFCPRELAAVLARRAEEGLLRNMARMDLGGAVH